MNYPPLPIGIDNFAKVITGNYYYIDKTWMIKELLDKKNEVNLFTRPRRFGKTLNLSMLQYFFEDLMDPQEKAKAASIFKNLKIMTADQTYISYMGKYPVVSLSLKSAKQSSFSSALYKVCEEVRKEFARHSYVLDSLSGINQEEYLMILERRASIDVYSGSLRFLSDVLCTYHQTPVIILIDEYDVPLENAYFSGFYQEMIEFIRTLFESALKTNRSLEFAVVSGCLRISRESIFTGLNNFSVISILSSQYDECFGFSQAEVDHLLSAYHLEKEGDLVKKWYNGYLFGRSNIYNPWSIINYVQEAAFGGFTFPRPYWLNTSSNNIVRELIKHADISVKAELETLMEGNTIEKPVHEDITYDSVYDSCDNLWNFLFFTGYLKQTKSRIRDRDLLLTLAIPNEEVAYIYDYTIKNWFRSEVKAQDLSDMYQAMLRGDAAIFQQWLSAMLQKSISYLDSREAFYHGFLLGVLGNMQDYIVKSNQERGDGRFDILVRSPSAEEAPVILELKIANTFAGMDAACDDALSQIRNMRYADGLSDEGYPGVWNYGIAFFRKQCRVKAVYQGFQNRP